MKKIVSALLFISVVASNSYSQANTALSNLVSPTSINQTLTPASNNGLALGSAARSWRFLYIDSQIYIKDLVAIHSRGTGNFFTGQSAGNLAFTGIYNAAFGQTALNHLTNGSSNVALGFSALYENTSGSNNTAAGTKALNFNTSGKNNVASGYRALYTNTAGYSNVAIGMSALYGGAETKNQVAVGDSAMFLNRAGSQNVGVGSKVLYSNGGGSYNTATGFRSMYSNTDGGYNVAVGSEAMYATNTGSYNVGAGYQTLYYNKASYNTATGAYTANNNTTGTFNTGAGFASLYLNNTGSYNTGTGAYAGYSNVSGSGNTALGYFADFGSSAFTNATAVGYNAVATASNQVMLGNSSVTSVRAAGSVVIYSDGRFKKDVQQNVPGLEFIKQLRPVTYHYDIHGINDYTGATAQTKKAREIMKEKNDADPAGIAKQAALEESSILAKEKKLYTGFVAQEVDAVAQKMNFDFSGVYHPENDKDLYGLSYSDFVVPLVKAVQELSDNADKLVQLNAEKDKQISLLEARLEKLESLLKVSPGAGIISSGSLEQNTPNPVKNATVVAYTLPARFSTASIQVTDAAGKLIKSISLNGRGRGTINLSAANLASGIYQYTLYIDKSIADSKQLIVVK
jgi:trimeric autotransporter adhesin